MPLDKHPDKQTLDDFKKLETEDVMDKLIAFCSRRKKAEPDKFPAVDNYKNLFEMTLFHEVLGSC
ncbi:hypothetical protein SLS60_009687 [Paraconiothyrium brasiliense]|uniref:Uncharacterized protein n=1 Tax=Paraconiothyrium brasiliense TaxID=300254 RepID=A0ABR3QV21_9PLEO